MNYIKNILIKGEKNSGKSFLVKRVIKYFSPGIKMAGFFTFKLENGLCALRVWDNFCLLDEGPIMIFYDPEEGRVRKNVFEELGTWSLERALNKADLVVMDELGRFEISCNNFISAVLNVLKSEIPALITLKNEKNSFLEALTEAGSENNSILFKITPQNRDTLYKKIISLLNTTV